MLLWLNRPSWAASRDATVFHATHPKAGSQWVYAVLARLQPDRVVTPLPACAHALEHPLRRGGVYPAVYATEPVLARVGLPEGQRTFAVIRDLRDTLVSFYFSMRYSHPVISPAIAERRAQLATMDEAQGLAELLESKSLRFFAEIQESWVGRGVPVHRYEELVADPVEGFCRIAEHCQLPVSRRDVRRAVEACAFERLSGGRSRGAEDRQSHLRRATPGEWREHLTPDMRRRFAELHGRTLVATGYEAGERW